MLITMRTFSYLSFFLLLFTATEAQQIKKITESSGGKHNKRTTVYHVLADNPQVKHGFYEESFNGNVTIAGYYKNGLKDSIWNTFYKGRVTSKKVYKDGQKTGLWESYTREGKPAFSFDFEKNQGKKHVKDMFPDTTVFLYEMPNGAWEKDPSVILPVKLYTPANWQLFLLQNLRYPQGAIDNNMQGTVIMSVLVNENGDAIDYEIHKSAGAPLDEEGLRLMKLFKPEFVPAVQTGKRIIYV
jgi:TonB family protein